MTMHDWLWPAHAPAEPPPPAPRASGSDPAGPNLAAAALLEERLARLEIDKEFLEATNPELLAKLEVACRNCPDWRQCMHDMASGAATSGLDKYCPNAATLDDLILGRLMG